jgi:hypothetical protein
MTTLTTTAGRLLGRSIIARAGRTHSKVQIIIMSITKGPRACCARPRSQETTARRDAPAAAGIGSRVRSASRSGTHNRFDSLLRDEDGRRDRRERINEKKGDGAGGEGERGYGRGGAAGGRGGENGALASAAAH